MNTFTNKVLHTGQQQRVRTENDAATNKTSESALVDLFFRVGGARGQNLNSDFSRAFGESDDLALRILLWARDARGGAGERQTFRNLLRHLEQVSPNAVARIIRNVPVVGRWDDLLVFKTDYLKNMVFGYIAEGLVNPKTEGLVAKWMPRKGPVARELRQAFELTPKQYRNMLVAKTNVVEQQMCAKDWSEINYEHVPSVAMSRYMKAFWRHSPERMQSYIDAVKKGEKKVNASVAFPYDVLRAMHNAGDVQLANEQWKALPDYVPDGESFLPMVDVSGSMDTPAAGSVTNMDVAISLGIYLSERNKSAFKNVVLTFSGSPELIKINGDLSDRYAQIARTDWGMNTNLEAAFKAVLDHAFNNKVKANDMPKTLIILSDMEFDACVSTGTAFNNSYRSGHWNSAYPTGNSINQTLYENLRDAYNLAGYALPKVVFWNLSSRHKNFPVTVRDENTALVSGFSPSIVKQVLGAKLNPYDIMVQTVNVERYTPLD